MLNTILIPTDGSETANRAVALGADLAERYGSKVILLHVLLHGESAIEFGHLAEVEHLLEAKGTAVAEDDPPPTHVLEKFAEQILGAAERALRRKGVTQVVTKTATGDPAKQILACAEAEGTDLIVTGSRGLGTLKGLLVGSVSQKVSHLAPCSCLTVR